MRGTPDQILGNLREVSADRIEHLIRTQNQPVRSVFPRSPVPLPKKFHIAVTLISLRIFAPIKGEPFGTISRNVQHLPDKQHPHRFTNWNPQNFRCHTFPLFQCHPSDRLPTLPTKKQSPVRILRQTNPRTILRSVRPQNMLNFKPLYGLQHFTRSLRQLTNHRGLRSVSRPIDRF